MAGGMKTRKGVRRLNFLEDWKSVPWPQGRISPKPQPSNAFLHLGSQGHNVNSVVQTRGGSCLHMDWHSPGSRWEGSLSGTEAPAGNKREVTATGAHGGSGQPGQGSLPAALALQGSEGHRRLGEPEGTLVETFFFNFQNCVFYHCIHQGSEASLAYLWPH